MFELKTTVVLLLIFAVVLAALYRLGMLRRQASLQEAIQEEMRRHEQAAKDDAALARWAQIRGLAPDDDDDSPIAGKIN